NWGVNLSHIPYRYGQYYPDPDVEPQTETTLDGKQQYLGYKDDVIVQRQFQERFGLFAAYPFSVTKRVEVGAAYEYYHQRVDHYVNYIDYTGVLLGQDKERIPASGSQNLASVNAALVGDNSYFGLTAPLKGYRYRLGVEQYEGAYKFSTLLLDGRRYFYLKPITLAFRGLGYGRFGGNANNTNEVFPLFAGQSYFVRGYTSSVLSEKAPELYAQMSGSKLGVFNAEIRLPFTGPRQLSLIKSGFLVTDLNLFFDAGVGFFNVSDFNPTVDPDPLDGRDPVRHKPILSTGISMRVNVFGALVLEPYFALPLSVPADKRAWTFGLNFVPGW
ncbi:MAG: tolB protein precursor, partial [Saprospiraceae bacterium]